LGWLGNARHLFWSWWVWIAVAVILQFLNHSGWSVACACIGFIFYLITPQEHVPVYGLEPSLRVQSREFLTNIVGNTGVEIVKNNTITVMNNGDEFYPAMLDAISNAERTITMEAYVYWKGQIGMCFAKALAERRRAGVEVKLLLDAVGSASIGREILGILKDSGCDVVWYNPLRFRTIGRFNNRTHRKSLMIDGRIAFTGGAGIADQWTGHAQDPQHWRDIQISVEGPGAFGLQTGFVQNWLATTGELITGPGYFPCPEPAGTTSIQTILSTPESGSSGVRIMYYLSIVSAKESIHIANPYFVPDDSAVEILVEASQRGVDVKIMVAGIYNDVRLSRYSGIHLYGKLLEAGVEIYEYNRTMMHQKTMVVDGVWSTVGTTNFDNRSFALNEESNICVYDRSLAEKLDAIFAGDLKECQRVTLEGWRNRGWKSRLLGAVCVFLKEQT
jgi:cardiolipin synthase